MLGHVIIYKDEVSFKVYQGYLALPNYTVINEGEDDEGIKFITAPDEVAVNDNVIYQMLVEDLKNLHQWDNGSAVDWVGENAEAVITAMWDAYSREVEAVEFRGESNE